MPNYCCGKIRCSKHHDNMCPLDCEHRNYCKRQIKFSETYCYLHNMHNNNTKSIPVHAMWTQSQLCICAPQNWCIPVQNNNKSRTNCLSWNKSSNLSLININIRIKTLIKNLNQNCTCEYG